MKKGFDELLPVVVESKCVVCHVVGRGMCTYVSAIDLERWDWEGRRTGY